MNNLEIRAELKKRVMAVSAMTDIVRQNKVSKYAGRIIVPNRVAETLKEIDRLFGLNWLCVSDVDTRYFQTGERFDGSDCFDVAHHKAVFLSPYDEIEYSFENLPLYLDCGYTSTCWYM